MKIVHQDLIEQLGDYEKVKEWYDENTDKEWVGIYHIPKLYFALLEYRRENGIFEVGDVVVGRDYEDFDNALLTITNKFTHDGKPCVVFECTRTICDDFESEVRHATNHEIKAGCRL